MHGPPFPLSAFVTSETGDAATNLRSRPCEASAIGTLKADKSRGPFVDMELASKAATLIDKLIAKHAALGHRTVNSPLKTVETIIT
jgi:hypothetical protein